MSYQVLARKWRPKNFHELVGQDHVRKALVSALDNDRLHHAYLFTGTRGVGKTTIARIIAKCLNCETGVTSRPCGECTSCREIDEGRFVDLIEVDAASRTKVEDTRELLDNVQYAPSRGRYKVYLIDEVHMLSTHSFNALLKTLEEPPPHVKFLLATTDPQKLPVTVLSRCLQFNLKNMPPERVVEHLSHVLTQEQIPFEDAALWQLGRAADGSMRDALSLTDQAIAYGQGSIDAAQVSEMLGLVDHRHVSALIDHLINRDAKALLSEVARLSEQAADFETILSDMALYLHRMAVAQVLPDAVDNAQGDREQVLAQAARLAAEDVQLYYQIAIKSQEDLPLAPDARTGFEMAMIRMVAFAPQGVPSENGNPLPSQAAPLAHSAPEAQVSVNAEQIEEQSDEAHGGGIKKKALTHSEDIQRAEPESAPKPEQESVPVSESAQEAKLTPETASPLQNNDASLVKVPRTVRFPSATAEKVAQAEAAPISAASSDPTDIPPWEELPVIPEQSPQQSPEAPELSDQDTAQYQTEAQYQADAQYQAMMPEPISEQPKPAPELRDIALPEAEAPAITPLVGPCPDQLNSNQDWLLAFAHLPLKGLDRSLAKNAALIGREGSHLRFALKAVTENFLTPERQASWQQSIQTLFNEALTIEIIAFSTDLDTPEDYEAELKATRQRQAETLFESDPIVQGLKQNFGAEVISASVEPLI